MHGFFLYYISQNQFFVKRWKQIAIITPKNQLDVQNELNLISGCNLEMERVWCGVSYSDRSEEKWLLTRSVTLELNLAGRKWQKMKSLLSDRWNESSERLLLCLMKLHISRFMLLKVLASSFAARTECFTMLQLGYVTVQHF